MTGEAPFKSGRFLCVRFPLLDTAVRHTLPAKNEQFGSRSILEMSTGDGEGGEGAERSVDRQKREPFVFHSLTLLCPAPSLPLLPFLSSAVALAHLLDLAPALFRLQSALRPQPRR